jgi:hypothetical protein
MNAKLTKGLAAAAISAAMMLGAAAPALAEVLPIDDGGVYYLTKTYNGVSDGTVKENLSFKVEGYKVTDAKVGTDISKLPVSITNVDATSGQDNKVKLTLPGYTSAGYYYYKVNENAGNTAGVTYNTNTYYLKVTVSYDDKGAAKVDSVSLWDADPTVEGTKTDHKVAGFENTYNSGTLEVKKVIAGNLAQDDEEFTIKVTFTSTKPVGSVVSYKVGTETKNIAAAWTESDGTYTASADITVKGGSTVDFSNLPDGVQYSVEETNSGHDYKASYKNDKGALEANKKVAFNANETKGDKDDTVTVTNTKESKVDAGVLLNNAPYIAIIGGAAVVAIYVVSKRRHSDMD